MASRRITRNRAWAARGLAALVSAVQSVAVLLAVGGCMVGPNFKPPQATVANDWRSSRDSQAIARAAVDALWWKAFNDPTLDRLVEIAYHQNLPLKIAAFRIVEARAQLAIASGRQFPQVQVAFGSLSAVGLSENAANSASLDRRFLDFQVGFDAVWELDFWGKYRRGVEAEAATMFGTMADYYYSLISLTAEVARTYAVIRTFEVLIAQAEENARIQEEALRIADSRFRNGATSELDVTQATVLYESTRASIPRLETGLQQARNALSTLLGEPAGGVEGLLVGPKQIPTPPAAVAVGVPAELLRRRPDIRAAEMYAAAQSARIGIAQAELYPSFSLFGTIGLQSSKGAGASFNPFSTSSIFYSVGPRIHWPFFNYGRLKNQVRVEEARFQQLLMEYRDTVLRAAQEVEDAMSGFVNAQATMAFEEKAVEAALRSVEIAMVQYREGAVDYQRVLDTQRSLLEQQNSLAETRSEVTTNLIALYKGLGGGWEMHDGKPIAPSQSPAPEPRPAPPGQR